MNAGTPNTPKTRREMLEAVTSIVRRNPDNPKAIAAQLMYLIPEPEEMPTLDQMEMLIDTAYKLGWKDRSGSIFRKDPPTVTILPEPDGSWTFLYDGKPHR